MALPTQYNQVVDEAKEGTFGYAMQLATSVVLPMALKATVDLGVFEIIAGAGPLGTKLSVSEIVAKIPARNPEDSALKLDRILRLLACHGVLGCSADAAGLERSYSLTPVSKHYVRNHDGVSLGPLLALNVDKVFLESWSQLKNAVVEGGTPFDMVYGMQPFEYCAIDHRFNQVFNEAMLNSTTIVMKKLLESYKGFEQLRQLVDVGGGMGLALKEITSMYPHLKGINFDLPHVIEHAPPCPGVEHIAGDMFDSIPKGDSIFLKWILHDWNDEKCVMLLKNCQKAIPDDGKVIVVESVVPIVPEVNSTAKNICQMDVVMMAQHQGGKERTQHEFKALVIGAGFRGINYVCFVNNLCVMEIFK